MAALLPTAVLYRQFMVEHTWFSGAIAFLIGIAIHFRSHAEYFFDCRTGILSFRTGKPARQTASENSRAKLSDIMVGKVRKMMEEDAIYKDNDLTEKTLSKKLGVSRSTMSEVLASAFGMPFRDYVNGKRIEYAKQYMLSNPKATQEAIAAECGFKDGNTFNRQFKKIVGKTPLTWLVENSS